MTRGLDTLWKLHWVLLSWQGLGKWMSCMAWIGLTVHWIVSDCDLGEVSVYTPSKGCVGDYVCMDYIRVLEGMLRTCVLDHKGRGLIALSGICLQQ